MAQKLSDPPPSQMHLWDNYIPGIHDGSYRLIAQHTISPKPGKDYHYYQDQQFIVKGPRFYLPPDEFHAQFPGDGTTGDFSRFLPHIILKKRALLWERWFDKAGFEKEKKANPNHGATVAKALQRPWLALLVVPESDLTDYFKTNPNNLKEGGPPHKLLSHSTPKDLIGKPTYSRTTTDSELSIHLPTLADEGGDGQDGKTSILVVDLPYAIFEKAKPAIDDLPFLSHVRVVENLNKPKTDMHVQGDFGGLLGNRFPQEGLNHVFLVSLEGWEGAFDGTRTFGNTDWMRFVMLKYWSFNNNANAIHTFGEVADGINNYKGNKTDYFKKQQKVKDNDPRLATQFKFSYQEHLADGFTPNNFSLPILKKADGTNPSFANGEGKYLKDGYVPIEYRPHNKVQNCPRMMAWFRGPFSPVKMKDLTVGGQPAQPFARADEAMIIDDKSGVPDISYSAAWQLGRSMGLGSPSLAQGIRNALYDHQNKFDGLINLLDDLNNYRTDLPPLWEKGTKPTDDKALVLEGHILDFIARLALLDTVPFHYLVPDERLLPPESIRFFYIDNNWIEAIIDGVLSIGVESTNDYKILADARTKLNGAISEMVYLYRLKELSAAYFRMKKSEAATEALKDIEKQLAGIVTKEELEYFINNSTIDSFMEGNQTPKPANHYLTNVKSGFLLRSELANHWPGLEIQIWGKLDPKDPIDTLLTPLRFEHISDTTILCIVVGKVNKVTFKEPPEGISFGVDDEGKIMLRHIKDSIGMPIKPSGTELKFPSGKDANGKEKSIFDDTNLVTKDAGGLNVTALVSELAKISDLKKEISSTNLFGPAALGLQLIRSPEEKDFIWEYQIQMTPLNPSKT